MRCRSQHTKRIFKHVPVMEASAGWRTGIVERIGIILATYSWGCWKEGIEYAEVTEQLIVQGSKRQLLPEGGQAGGWGWPQPGREEVQSYRVWTWWAELNGSISISRTGRRCTRSTERVQSVGNGSKSRVRAGHRATTWIQSPSKIGLEICSRVVQCLYKPIICTHLFSIRNVL